MKAYQDSAHKQTLPITWKDRFAMQEKGLIEEAINWQLLAWQLDHKKSAAYIRVEVKRKPFPDENGDLFYGRYYGNRIVIYAGKQLEAPAFYHELCHTLDSDSDDHDDPRWPAWRKRNKDLCNFLIQSRKR